MTFLLIAAISLLTLIAVIMAHNAVALRRLNRRLNAREQLEALSRQPDDDGGGHATPPILRVIKGGAAAVVGVASVTIAWSREHPAAAVVGLAAVVTTSVLVAASSPTGTAPDIGNPVAIPPEPVPTITIGPATSPPAPPRVTPAPPVRPPKPQTEPQPSPAPRNIIGGGGEQRPARPIEAPPSTTATPTTPTSVPIPVPISPAIPTPPAPTCELDVNLRPVTDLCLL